MRRNLCSKAFRTSFRKLPFCSPKNLPRPEIVLIKTYFTDSTGPQESIIGTGGGGDGKKETERAGGWGGGGVPKKSPKTHQKWGDWGGEMQEKTHTKIQKMGGGGGGGENNNK